MFIVATLLVTDAMFLNFQYHRLVNYLHFHRLYEQITYQPGKYSGFNVFNACFVVLFLRIFLLKNTFVCNRVPIWPLSWFLGLVRMTRLQIFSFGRRLAFFITLNYYQFLFSLRHRGI